MAPGALKTLLDLLPERALEGKIVLPLATGGTIAHMLAVDYALKPVLNALKAQEILHGVFADDSQVTDYQHKPQFTANLQRRLDDAHLCVGWSMLNPLRALTLGGLLLFSMLGHAAPAAPDALRIGYQKGSVSMVLAKSHQLLEQRYPQTHISWIEFPAGPQMLEALNVGSIDIGSTGDIPPIFAQAAGADLVYIGAEPPKPKAEVILVAQGSITLLS